MVDKCYLISLLLQQLFSVDMFDYRYGLFCPTLSLRRSLLQWDQNNKITKQSALKWATQTSRIRMYRAARDIVIGKENEIESKVICAIPANSKTIVTEHKISRGSAKVFQVNAKVLWPNTKHLRVVQNFASECKCFVTEHKVSHGSTNILWPNAKLLRRVQKYCDWTQSFSVGAKVLLPNAKVLKGPQNVSKSTQNFCDQTHGFLGERKSFVTKHNGFQGNANIFQVNAQPLWPKQCFSAEGKFF